MKYWNESSFSDDKANALMGHDTGQITRLGVANNFDSLVSALTANQIQKQVDKIIVINNLTNFKNIKPLIFKEIKMRPLFLSVLYITSRRKDILYLRRASLTGVLEQ